ncbi:MAG: T9SS type A sorting domain-containing protein [Balneola sp.]|nr:T9SS type A sorting domain-containing protein [Balneola sp.]MBO6651623.1 T9SS type A sorting domain-containing protein [Balneola sp.]MBO6710711.1 T9SS type A sorting domain-containing protein [Balneola sp.]MBO6799397.1 T9SS type A sorting domain-containing protein [Balneola sp.]MBO6869474.1 T9SS type A sorting domain-containing protein [Balneola sp.]
MKIIFITIGISFFTILNISAQGSNWEFKDNFPANGFISQFDSSGVHSLAVDGEGKVWFQLWELTSVTEINGQNTAISPIFVFNEDGSESEISPINLVVVGTDTTFFTETNARGMSTDNNGDIIASYGSKLFRIDHSTGEGLDAFESPESSSLTKTSVSSDGKIVVGHVFPDLPIYYLDENLSIITNVVDSRTGFARTVEISEDGKEVFVFKHTENRIEVHSLDTLNNTFSYSRDILSGISAESSVINGDKLWAGGGHNSDPHGSSEFQNYTWYEFDLNTETITNQIKWNFSGPEIDLRPRGITFSLDNKTIYLGQFFGDGESIIQKFQQETVDENIVKIRELNTYEGLDSYSSSNIQNHPLTGVEVTYTGVVISNPTSSGLASGIDSNSDGIIDDIGRIHIFITDTSAVTEGREGMSIQITESDWELLDTLKRGDVVTFKGELTFFNATSQMTVNEEPNILGSVFDEYDRFQPLLEPWEISIDEVNIINPDGTTEINFSNYSKYNGSYVKFSGVSVNDVTNSDRLVWSLNNGTSKVFIYDHSLRIRNDRTQYLEGWNYRRDSEIDFAAPEIGSIANISGFLAITNYEVPEVNLAPDKDVFTLSPFEDGVLWIGDSRFEDGDDIGDGKTLSWPNDIEIVEGPVDPNSYDLEIDFKVNMAVQQEIGNFDPEVHEVRIAGNFNSWSTTQDVLTIDFDTTYSTKLMIPNNMVGDSISYKFMLVDEGGGITWELLNDRIYHLRGLEPDLNLDGTRGIVLNHLFNNEGYGSIDNKELEIKFSVDMSVQVDKGKFNPDSMTAQLAGSFTGWSSPVDMQNIGDHKYDITQSFIDPIPGDTIFYKFVYTKADSIVYEDPNPDISPVATEFNNRFYVFTGTEVDTDGDDIKDVVLDRVLFSDDDGSVPKDSVISLSIETVNAFITDTIEIPIQITGLGDLSMSSFELAINFDPALIDLELSDNPESLTSDFLVESNKTIPGKIVVSGASTSSISSDGDLLFLNVYPQASGTGSIEIDRLTLNEDVELVNPAQSLVTIIERVCGDVTDDRTVSTLDATFVLRHTVFLSPQYPLTGLDSVAADVTGNGDISAFDASRILQFEVGFIDDLGCKTVASKKEPLFTKALWHKVEKEDEVFVTIDVSNNDFDIYSAQLDMKIEEGLSFSRINNKPKNWQTLVNSKEGSTLVSMFGVQPLESKSLELVLTKDQRSLKASVNANVTLNESELYKLNELIVNTLPDEFSLKQNYPNPFNPSTNIEYSLPEQANVTLTIYNMLGQKVATLVNETLAAGTYSQTWDASSVSSGVYFYRLKAGNKIFTKRMLLVK